MSVKCPWQKNRFQSWKLGKNWIVNGSFTIANGSACGSSIRPQALVRPREWKTTCWAAKWNSFAKKRVLKLPKHVGMIWYHQVRSFKTKKIGSDVKKITKKIGPIAGSTMRGWGDSIILINLFNTLNLVVPPRHFLDTHVSLAKVFGKCIFQGCIFQKCILHYALCVKQCNYKRSNHLLFRHARVSSTCPCQSVRA